MGQNSLKCYLLAAMLFIGYMASAQDIRRISGKIEDAYTGYTLPYASVSLKNSSYSNVTNSEGEFSLNIPLENLKDSILVSFLGYRNATVAVSEFLSKKMKRVKLVPTAIDIRSITVRTDDAADLFRSAFSNKSVKANYPTKGAGMSGFYREIIKKGSKYLSLSEAVVDILKQSYTSTFGDNISIYKGRGNVNRNASDMDLIQSIIGGADADKTFANVKDKFVDIVPAASGWPCNLFADGYCKEPVH